MKKEQIPECPEYKFLIFFSSAEVSDGEVEEEVVVEDELKLREEAEARLRYAQNCKH